MNLIERGRVGAERLAVARMAVGLCALVAPRTFARVWIGTEGGARRVATVTRAFGVRDFVLGLGLYRALKGDEPVRGWIETGVLSDSTDVVCALTGPPPAVRRFGLAGAAMIGVVGAVLALEGLEETAER